jgi:hypothetical protein
LRKEHTSNLKKIIDEEKRHFIQLLMQKKSYLERRGA